MNLRSAMEPNPRLTCPEEGVMKESILKAQKYEQPHLQGEGYLAVPASVGVQGKGGGQR